MAGGSGTIVDSGGSILTNHHVLHDPYRSRAVRPVPHRPLPRRRIASRSWSAPARRSAGVLRPDLDLALIRCDSDLNAQPWWPEFWPAVPLGDSTAIVPGEQVWVLGYPNAGGSSIRVSAGLVSGWTGEHGGAASRAFMRTDAAISAGNSGGTAADRFGRLIGVPTAFRALTAERGGNVTAIGKVGLIRPIELARDLIAAGRRQTATWPPPPRPGEDASLPADPYGQRVLVTGTVTDAGSLRPVRGAYVGGPAAGRRGRGRAGAGHPSARRWWRGASRMRRGRFVLEPPLPRGQRYTVGVIASGYEPALEIASLRSPERGGAPSSAVARRSHSSDRVQSEHN